MSPQLTKTAVAAFMRGIHGNTGEPAIVRGAAGLTADAIETGHVDSLLRELKAIAEDPGMSNETRVTAILTGGGLAMTASPDLPAET